MSYDQDGCERLWSYGLMALYYLFITIIINVPAHPGSPGQRAVKWVRYLLAWGEKICESTKVPQYSRMIESLSKCWSIFEVRSPRDIPGVAANILIEL